MSRVIVRPLNILGGGGGDLTRFSDSFQRADQPFGVGTDWFSSPDMGAGSQTIDFAGAFNIVGGTQFRVTNPTGGGFLPVAYMMPRSLSYSKLNGRDQFAKVVVAGAAGTSRVGLSVLTQVNASTCYVLFMDPELAGHQWELLRRVNGGGAGSATLIAANAARVFAFGDEMGLSVTIAAGIPSFIVTKNGVSVGTATDNSGSQLITGMPGMMSGGASAGASIDFQNFVAGAGAS